MPTTNGRALPTWARAYTVGPQKYIRTGPGGGGSSTSERENVSYRRIELARVVRGGAPRRAAARAAPPTAPARARRRSARAAAPAGRRRRPSARARAPSPRPCRARRGAATRSSTNRSSVSGLATRASERTARARTARAPAPRRGRARRAASGAGLDGNAEPRASSRRRDARARRPRATGSASRSRCTSCRGRSSSSRYARTASAGIAGVAERRDGRALGALRELLAVVRPRRGRGGSPAAARRPSARWSAACSSSFGRWSEPRMTWVIAKSASSTTLARWNVGEPSSRQSITPSNRCGSPAARAASRWRSGPLALPDRPLVPADSEPAQVLEDRPPPRPAGCAPGRCRRSAAAGSRRSAGSRRR